MLIFIASVGAMVLFALALLVPALWRTGTADVVDQHDINVELAREQLSNLSSLHKRGVLSDTEFEQRRDELALTLASSFEPDAQSTVNASPSAQGQWMAWLVGLFVPISAVIIYLQIGFPDSLDQRFIENQSVAQVVDEKLPPIDELLPRLEAHLQDNPEDGQGWRMLGVTYLRMQRFTDADSALTRALELDVDNIDLLFQLADAKAMLAGGQLAGAPEQLINRALELSPDDARGIWVSGMAKQQQGEHEAAVAAWRRLLPRLDNQPQAKAEVEQLIAEAENSLAGSTAGDSQASAPVEGVNVDANNSAAIAVNVSLAPALTGQVSPNQALYIYAKAVAGPPMPLAVSRLTVADLPVTIMLDDSMAMLPNMTLSTFDEVVVGARISFSGNPVAQSGDFFGEVSPVNVDQATSVDVQIAITVP